jgi:UDP-glucose 4,6-dehydratase
MFDQLILNEHVVTLAPHDKALSAMRDVDYDWVVNCAGVTGVPNVDACEKDKAKTFQGNAVYPIQLYEYAKKRNMRFAHFSSGCIYEGRIDSVMADPNFFGSTYSVSKGVSDTILKQDPDVLMFRVRLPFDGSHSSKNLLTKLYNYAKNGKLIEGGQNSITDIDEAVQTAAKMIDTDEAGVYNLVQWNPITSAEIVAMMGIQAEWFTADEFKAATAARRSNCAIPAYEHATPVEISLAKAIEKFNKTL